MGYLLFKENRVVFKEGDKSPDIANTPRTGKGPDIAQKDPEITPDAAKRGAYAGDVAKAAKHPGENPSKADVPKAGLVHAKYFEKSGKLAEDVTQKDEALIRGSTTKDLRKKARLLNVKPEGKTETKPEVITNLKDEAARRLRAYTNARDGEWYTLDYQKFGNDSSGLSHEMNVGLGDILLDPDIKEVLVEKSGVPILAHRGIVEKGPHKGRVGFIDNQGNYVATYTGDKFKILSNKETDSSKKDEVNSYIKSLQSEDKAREETEVIMQRTNFDVPEGLPSSEVSVLDPNKPVVDQITKRLRSSQLEAARIIEEEFKTAGLTNPNLIAAAIINANYESGLIPENTGALARGEDSVGLFQLNAGGAGKGMSIADRKDPRINTRRIIEEIKGPHGKRLRPRALAGASVQELSYLFCYDIERPAKREGDSRQRANDSFAFFPRKPVEASDTLVADYKSPTGHPAFVNLKSGQDTWFLGSSSAEGLGYLNKDRAYGTYALRGGDAGDLFQDLQTTIWPKIEKMNLPRQIVLVGLELNGLNSNQDPAATAKANIEQHLRIAKFFEGKGIQVKIVPGQLYEPKKAAILAFNNLLKTQYSPYFLDTGTDAPGIPLDSKEHLHLTAEGYRKILAKALPPKETQITA